MFLFIYLFLLLAVSSKLAQTLKVDPIDKLSTIDFNSFQGKIIKDYNRIY